MSACVRSNHNLAGFAALDAVPAKLRNFERRRPVDRICRHAVVQERVGPLVRERLERLCRRQIVTDEDGARRGGRGPRPGIAGITKAIAISWF